MIKTLLFVSLLVCVMALAFKDRTGSCVCGNITKANADTLTVNGAANLSNQSCKNLRVNGAASLEKITVSEEARVNGAADLIDCECGTLRVNGAANFDKVQVRGVTRVNGAGNFERSQLHDLELSGKKFHFEDCKVQGDIFIQESSFFFTSKNQSIRLKDTIIEGDITFESGNGKVYLKGSSQVNGKIIGAEVL